MKKVLFLTILLLLAASAMPGAAFTGGSHAALSQQASSPYVIPAAGATFVPSGASISMRSERAVTFIVQGLHSGQHTGNVALADDGQTWVFQPDQPFSPGETVQVSARGQTVYGWSFTVAPAPPPPAEDTETADAAPPESGAAAGRFDGYLTLPEGFPDIEVTVAANDVGEGYIFTGPNRPGNAVPLNFLAILDNTGEPVYVQSLPLRGMDFKKQPNGLLTYIDSAAGSAVALDSAYRVVGSWKPVGYTIDVHDFLILPNDHKVFMIYDSQTVDMTAYGGLANATVVGLVIQEIDSQGLVVFQWASWDNIPFTDSSAALTTARVDYVHGNSVELDVDDNLLISARHLDEVFKLDHETGDIIWRMGGKANQFTALGGTPLPLFVHQHDARRLADGRISVFDNRNDQVPAYSRVVEFAVDEEARTVTQVYEQRGPADFPSIAMGNAQWLPSNNYMVGWGLRTPVSGPNLTEFHRDGSKALEMTFSNPLITYRAFRFPWTGRPAALPTLLVQPGEMQTTLAFNWNGSTELAQWKIYGARSSTDEMTLLETKAKTGWETQAQVSDLEYCLFQVAALDAEGVEMSRSKVQWGKAECAPGRLHYLPRVFR